VSANSTNTIKSELAVHIVSLLDKKRLTVRTAGAMTATAAADLSRIRRGKLDRFTVDRLIAILTRLDHSLEISVNINERRRRREIAGEGER
jgi:predicted XRE-type DNA-binding protein